jgi:hypothetical protein
VLLLANSPAWAAKRRFGPRFTVKARAFELIQAPFEVERTLFWIRQ